MYYLRIFSLLITLLISPLFAITPEALITFSKLKVGTLPESPHAHDALRFYTYYQAKLLNDLTDGTSTTPEASLWGLLEKGRNPENVEQSSLEWHASVLKAQNWGNLDGFEWINAISQSDMILGFLNSAYTSVCLAGTNVVSKTDETLIQIQKQSIQFLLNTPTLTAGEHLCFETINPQKIKLAIQLGRNTYYQHLYRNNTVVNYETALQNDEVLHEIPLGSDSELDTMNITEPPPENSNIDVLSAHIADLEYDENSDAGFMQILENSYTVISNGMNTNQFSNETVIAATENEIISNASTTQNAARKSIETIQKILLRRYQLSVSHPELLLSNNPSSGLTSMSIG